MMPSENPWPIVIVCAMVVVGLLIAWSQQKRGWLLIATIIPIIVAALAIVRDVMVITDREQLQMNVRDMVGAFQNRDLEKTHSYISNSAPDIKLLVAAAYNLVRLGPDTRVTDIRVEKTSIADRAMTTFRVNSTLQVVPHSTSAYHPTMWEAKWEREPSGWKMIDIQQCDPITGKREPIPSEWRRMLNTMYPQNP
jgi:hypothetical protein